MFKVVSIDIAFQLEFYLYLNHKIWIFVASVYATTIKEMKNIIT